MILDEAKSAPARSNVSYFLQNTRIIVTDFFPGRTLLLVNLDFSVTIPVRMSAGTRAFSADKFKPLQ